MSCGAASQNRSWRPVRRRMRSSFDAEASFVGRSRRSKLGFARARLLSDEIGALLALDQAACLPSDGFVDEQHEGLVEQEEQVVLNDVVEMRGQVALDLWSVHLRHELMAVGASPGHFNALHADVTRHTHSLQELEHVVRGCMPEPFVEANEKTYAFFF